MKSSVYPRLISVLLAGSLGLAAAPAFRYAYSAEDFARDAEALALTEVRAEGGLVLLSDKHRGRQLAASRVVDMDGVITIFESLKDDSIFAVSELQGHRGSTLVRAANLKAYDKGKVKEEPIYAAGQRKLVMPVSRAMPDRFFFYEAAELVPQRQYMPYKGAGTASSTGTKLRWFNIPLEASVDSVKLWGKRVCGKPTDATTTSADEKGGYAYLPCR